MTAIGTTATATRLIAAQGNASTYLKYTRLGNAVTLVVAIIRSSSLWIPENGDETQINGRT